MSTLFDPSERATLVTRVRRLRPDSARQWGRMTPHQAVCHLADAFRFALGEKPAASAGTVMGPFMRWVALSLPMRWPHGVKTMPEMEQGIGGTPPLEFERDRAELLTLVDRFCARDRDAPWPAHPIFGAMQAHHWGRWGYRHLDHHLRQFGE